jgi:hypothetical protein
MTLLVQGWGADVQVLGPTNVWEETINEIKNLKILYV